MVSNFTFKHFFSHIYHYKMAELYPNQVGGGREVNGPKQIKMINSLQPIVQLVSNQAVNLISKFVHCLEVFLKKFNLDHEGTLNCLSSAIVLQNQPGRICFRVHLGVHEGPGGFPGSY